MKKGFLLIAVIAGWLLFNSEQQRQLLFNRKTTAVAKAEQMTELLARRFFQPAAVINTGKLSFQKKEQKNVCLKPVISLAVCMKQRSEPADEITYPLSSLLIHAL